MLIVTQRVSILNANAYCVSLVWNVAKDSEVLVVVPKQPWLAYAEATE